MPDLTTNPIPGFFGEYCAVVPKADPASFIAVGITPGDAWATARDKLGIDGKQLEAGYEITVFPKSSTELSGKNSSLASRCRTSIC